MARTKHIILILALVLLLTQGAISEEEQLSNTREASCGLQFTIYKDTLSLKFNTLIQSPGVKGKAIQEVFGSAPANAVEVSIDSTPAGHNETNSTFILDLKVHLSESDLKPAANEFLKAIVENMRESLIQAYNLQKETINKQYIIAKEKYQDAQIQITELNEEPVIRIYPSKESKIDFDTKRQLEERVDLSDIHESYSFEQVLNIIADSVDPPLQIQPNWRDLADMPDIQPTTPAEMEPLTNVKVSAAIEMLLSGLSTTPGVPLGYAIQDKIIIIATEEALPIDLVTTVYDISGLLVNGRTSNTLINAIKETIEPDSWYTTDNEWGEGKIIDMQGGKISIINTPEVHYKITDFLTNFPKELPSEPVEAVTARILLEEQPKLSSQKRMVELEVARLEARREAAEQQIIALSGKMKSEESLDQLTRERFNLEKQLEFLKQTKTDQHPDVKTVEKQLSEVVKLISSLQKDTIISEMEQLIDKQIKQLDLLKKEHEAQVANNMASRATPDYIIEAEEKLARTKIELARRREELARPVGIENLSALNENLSMTILELAAKKAELQVLERQLGEISSQIKAASTTDPRVVKYREAQKALEEAQKYLNELEKTKNNMQPPQVIAIGLE